MIVRRGIRELIDSLRTHVRLLRDYADQAFQRGDPDYLGEVAGKLRLLVYEQGRNKPLLILLMDEFQLDVLIKLDDSPYYLSERHPGEEVTLREFLKLTGYAFLIGDEHHVRLTFKELIGYWAQKEGAAHEDWQVPEEWKVVRDMDSFGVKMPASVRTLEKITKTVLYVADEFLTKLTLDMIARKHAEWVRNLKPGEVIIEGPYLFAGKSS